MPILKKLRAKLNASKAKLKSNRKAKKTSEKKVAKKPIASRLSKLQRAGETWSAYQTRIGNKKTVKQAQKKKKKAAKVIAKNTKKRGSDAKYGRDSKTGKIINLKTGKVMPKYAKPVKVKKKK